ncbi:MAG: oligosaccharide flippase family protein [Anaerolineae bacterium]
MNELIIEQRPGQRPEQRIAINSGLLLLAYGFQALVSLVIVGIVARYLGQAGLGRYAFIITFIELFTAIVDMGMNRILVREIAKGQDDASRLTSAIWTLRLGLALMVFLVVAALAANNGDPYLWLATMAFFVAQVIYLQGDVFVAMLQGYQRMEYTFWGIIVAQVLQLLLTVAVVWLNLGLVALFSARIFANSGRLLYLWITSRRKRYAQAHFMPAVLSGAVLALRQAPATVALWRRQGRAAARAHLDLAGARAIKQWQDAVLAWQLLVESLPVGISLLLHSYIWRAGIVLTVLWLGKEQGDLVNGVLYGPLRVVQQMHILPGAFAAALLPALSSARLQPHGRVRRRLYQEPEAVRDAQPAPGAGLHLPGRAGGGAAAGQRDRPDQRGAGAGLAGLGAGLLLSELAVQRDPGGAGPAEIRDAGSGRWAGRGSGGGLVGHSAV